MVDDGIVDDDLARKILRRQWLNQVLSWCIRGSIGGVEYTREQQQGFIEKDPLAIERIPEASILLQMFKTGKTTKEIETYLRHVL